MQLFYFPGACALAPHIMLEWSGQPYTATRVEKERLKEPGFLALNPTGQVPALRLPGGTVLTQAEAILMYLAEAMPKLKLGVADDPLARYEMHRWLSFFTGDLHPAFYPFFNPARFITDESQHDVVRADSVSTIDRLAAVVEQHMAGRDHMIADRRTILDPYLFVFCRWLDLLEKPLAAYPNLDRFAIGFARDAGVQAAMNQQSIGFGRPS